ncbi:MAG: DNA-primase RepB domain-containing protein [Thiomonas arsenitoxydans]|nr:DNA-primase RepB domain-containing protein [Thiomonas arsenitoxydans]
MTPHEQTQRFINFMLQHASELEFAAAHYVLPGADKSKVDRVVESRLRVRSIDQMAALLPWLRAQNANGLNIWSRPAASLKAHPLLMLDDLPTPRAQTIARKYRAAAVETSPGNCQVWLCCDRPLDRVQRQDVLRRLCDLVGSDPGAISEPRWGRLAGFRQQKPEKPGSWTNLLSISHGAPLFDPTPHLVGQRDGGGGRSLPALGRAVVPSFVSDGEDMSRREFGYACHALRSGLPAHIVEERIAAHVAASGRSKSRDYAQRTVAAARHTVGQFIACEKQRT